MFIVGCASPQPPAPAPEPDKPAAPVLDLIPQDTVSFVKLFPGSAQKNVYAEWKHFSNPQSGEKSWQINHKPVSNETALALDELFAAISDELIPSDGMYACRFRDDMPLFKLEFEHLQKKYVIVSASDCLHAAPFNVIVDGKSYLQINGKIGTALENLLSSSRRSLKIGENAAMLMFDKPVTLPNMTFDPVESPLVSIDKKFREDALFGASLAHIESLFGKLELPEVACNQAKSNDCRDLSARYTFKIGNSFIYKFSIRFENGQVHHSLPPNDAFDALANALKTPVLTAFDEAWTRENPLAISWVQEANCAMVRGLAEHFELKNDISCSAWNFTSKDLPSAIFYQGLQALWFKPDSDLKPYFEKLKSTLPPKKTKSFNYKKFMTPPAEMNLFIRMDGSPIAFVTKDGKTTIEQ